MIVVVEGKHDASKILSVFPKAFCIITNGSEISKETIDEIKNVIKKEKVYLFLDPDGPGNKIRSKIINNLTEDEILNVIVIYSNQEYAISKNNKKVGVEHMKQENIKELFNQFYETKNTGNITMLDIYKLGLADSKIKRKEICKKLNLGYCNAKQLVKRLNMHCITIDEVKKHI